LTPNKKQERTLKRSRTQSSRARKKRSRAEVETSSVKLPKARAPKSIGKRDLPSLRRNRKPERRKSSRISC